MEEDGTCLVPVLLAASLLLCSCGAVYSWQAIPADSHRTGVKATTADNVTEALGSVEGVIICPIGALRP